MKHTNTIIGSVLIANMLLHVPGVQAAEMLIFENDDTRPFTARNLIIDNKDKGGDLTLQFGKTLSEQFIWDSSNAKFRLTDDLDVQGTMSGTVVRAGSELTSSGTLAVEGATALGGTVTVDGAATFANTVNMNSTMSVDGAATFGSTITIGGVTYTFPGSDGSNGQVLQTDGAGTLSWAADDGGITQSESDNRFVNQSGDTMTGNLVIGNAATLSVSGAVVTEGNLTINEDNGAADAVLTFGNDAAAETLTFSDTTEQFEFSDDVHATGSLSASGALSVEGGIFQEGLTDCDAADSKVVWDATTGTFTCSTDLNQKTNFTLTADSGTDQTVSSGETVDIEGAASITTTVGATNKVTVDITDDSVDFTEISDTPSLDANTTVTFGGNTLTYNLEGSGDFDVQDNGTSVLFVNDSGNVGVGTNTPSEKLQVVGKATATHLHAATGLNSSGTLAVDGASTLGGAVNMNSTMSVDGAATFGSTVGLGGVTYTFPGADGTNGYVLTTDSAGNLSWTNKTAGSLTEGSGDDRYVNQSGDTMTGNLVIGNAATLSVSGAVVTEGNLTINENNSAADAVLTFGNDAAAETLIFSNSTERFEFSDEVHATGDLTASGTLSVEGAAAFGSTVHLGGVTYTFPGSDGSASGHILMTDSNGQLSWGTIGTGALTARERQILIPIDTAAVTTDGSNNEVNVYVGSQTGATANPHHYYRVESAAATLQDVNIRLKVLLPKDFEDFSNSNDLSFSYRTHTSSDSQNKLDILVEDGDGDDAFTAADGQDLANTAWTAYTDEFDGGSFDPAKGEYIYITITGYTNSSGMTYAGEVVLTYTSR